MTQTRYNDRLVDLGSLRMFCRTSGQPTGLPTFVLEAGAGGTARGTWPHVQDFLSDYGLVFSYDRANSGSSTTDGEGVGAAANTRRLNRLLAAAKVPAPYVLVGHSMGGLYMRHFAATHPESVAGLVLLDATPAQMKNPWYVDPIREVALRGLHWAARLGIVPWVMRLRGKPMEPRFAQQLAEFAVPGAATRLLDEVHASQELRETVASITPMLRHPTLSILAGSRPGASEKKAAELKALLESIHELSPTPGSRLVTIPDATHGTVVSDPVHAREVGAHILDFARTLGVAKSVRAE